MGVVSLRSRTAGRENFADDCTIHHQLERVTVRTMDEVRGAATALRDFADACGLRAALCADVASKEPMVDAAGAVLADEVFGWREEGNLWWSTDCLGLHSPLARACRYESEPFWANANGFFSPVPNLYLADIDPTKFFARSVSSRSAIVIPVHLPFAQISANSFHPYDRAITDLSELFAKVSAPLGALTRRFIAAYVSVVRSKRRIPADCELSKREVECLRWAAIGKTDREIGMILDLSHATVRYHTHRAGEKLNAINRAQTIFKAGQLGYLGANS